MEIVQQVLYRDLSLSDSTKLLGKETLERLNYNKTGFDFTGYNTKVPGYIILPVKLSSNPEKRAKQENELVSLGYEPMSKEVSQKYFKKMYENRTLYMIEISKLMKIHNM